MRKPTADPRRRLLDAGLKLFANRGYAGTAVQDITEEAKVTKPTLYYYFENKEGLFQALVDQAMDERLRLMREAAPAEKATVGQLTDIIVAVTDFAQRQPDLLRLCFSIAFAAEGEFPSGFKKHDKMHASIQFVRGIIQSALDRGVLNPAYTVDELTQAYFHLIQQSIVLTIVESNLLRLKPTMVPCPRMEPRRIVELFLGGAAKPMGASANGIHARPASRKTVARSATATQRQRLTKALAFVTGFSLSLLAAQGQTTNAPSMTTNEPAPVAAPAAGSTNPSDTNAVTTLVSPVMPDVRPIPLAVKASHPELATVSPIADNARDPHALDLQTCFQLTAIRDDSLKISLQHIVIARAQLSQSIAALWPTFTVNNQQEFLHYRNPANAGFSILGNSTVSGNRNYTSQSNVNMSFTVFNGGQNWNNVGASSASSPRSARRSPAITRPFTRMWRRGFTMCFNSKGT